jgi:hypothetical protein
MVDTDPGIFEDLARVPEVRVVDAADLDARLQGADTPFVVRGLVKDWPLVEAGRRSSREARAYLLRHHRDMAFTVAVGELGGDGRLFYDADMAMNFRTLRAKLPDIFQRMDAVEGRAGRPGLSFLDRHASVLRRAA